MKASRDKVIKDLFKHYYNICSYIELKTKLGKNIYKSKLIGFSFVKYNNKRLFTCPLLCKSTKNRAYGANHVKVAYEIS